MTGEAGHAGTVPMAMRRDALAAAAEMIAAVERIGARRADTVATVGAAKVAPGAVNVIAGEVAFTIDVRAPDDALRKAMVAEIERELRRHRRRARGRASRSIPSWTRPRPSWTRGSPRSSRKPSRRSAFRRCGSPRGAGHDAVAMATLCPVAMLFVRCKGGVSHNPAESIAEADADVAVRVLIEAVRRLAAQPSWNR